jgi:hypothetical protein
MKNNIGFYLFLKWFHCSKKMDVRGKNTLFSYSRELLESFYLNIPCATGLNSTCSSEMGATCCDLIILMLG